MNMNNKGLDYLALTVAIIGAINWGLIGFFSFDLVAFIFGNMSWLSRIIYAVVGIAGLYIITFYMYAGGAAERVTIKNCVEFNGPQQIIVGVHYFFL